MSTSATSGSTILDVHSHAVLDLGDGRDAGTDLPMELIPPWSVESGLALMDDVGITTSILSMSEAGSHRDDAFNRDRARQINEYLAGLAAEHPTRYGAMAVLPIGSTDDALVELEHALDTLHMDAVSLPTSARDTYLGDPRFDPVFAELDRRGATVFTHPREARASKPIDLGLNQAVLEFPFDTTRMLVSLIVNRTLQRHPHVRLIASHGGGTLPFLLSRLETLIPVVGPGAGLDPLTADEIRAGAAAFYYDLTAATSTAHLTALTQFVPASQLLMGFDIPYLRPQTMRPAIEAVHAWAGFDADDVEKIMHANAAGLFPSVAARLTA